MPGQVTRYLDKLRNGDADFARLQAGSAAVLNTAGHDPTVRQVMSPFRADAPQAHLEVDWVKIEALGESASDVFNAPSLAFGSSYVGQVSRFGRVLQVYVQADRDFRLTTRALSQLAVRSAAGTTVPLDALVSARSTSGPARLPPTNCIRPRP